MAIYNTLFQSSKYPYLIKPLSLRKYYIKNYSKKFRIQYYQGLENNQFSSIVKKYEYQK